jgi:hypothetical protein
MDRSRSRNRSLSRPVHSRCHQHSILVSPYPLADLCRMIQTGGICSREEDPMIQESLSWTDDGKEAPLPDTTLGTVDQNPQQPPMEMFSENDDTEDTTATMEVNTTMAQATATSCTDPGRDGDSTVGHDLCDDFCSAIFKSIPEPLLPPPTSSPTSPPKWIYSRRKQKNMVTTRSSVRLAARPSTCRWLNRPRGS